MYEIVDLICADIHPIQNLRILKKVAAQGMNKEEWAHDAIHRGFIGIILLIFLISFGKFNCWPLLS